LRYGLNQGKIKAHTCTPFAGWRRQSERSINPMGFSLGKHLRRALALPDAHPDREKAPDLLRRLEREVGPLADATTLTRVEPRSVLLRAFLPTAIVGMAVAALVIAWQHIPSDARQIETIGAGTSEAQEVAQLRAALVESEDEQRSLRTELSLARKELRSLEHRHPHGWPEDTNLLLYRSPWGPR
jgi:hypothetical protein